MIPSFSADEFADGSALDHCERLAVAKVVEGERGTWIAVPPTNVLERGSVPLVGCHVTRPGAPDAPLFDRAAILVACELETNEIHVAPAYPPPSFLDEPVVGGSQAMTGFGFSLEVCERLALPKRPGRYIMWMIVRERVSPPVMFRWVHDPSAFHDSEAEAFLHQAQAKRGPPPINPPPRHPLPRYAGLEDTNTTLEISYPEIPERGVALELPRVSFVDEPVVVSGSFRLMPRAHERFPHEPAPIHGPDLRGPSAVMNVRLVVTASDQIGPQVHALALPSFTRFHPSEKRPLLSGRFAFDWLALPEVWRSPRTYFIYVVAGGQLSGPHQLALVTRDMIPGSP